MSGLYRDAVHDAWTRLIRKRITSRLWKAKCSLAEERAIDVFCNNLEKVMLAPPPGKPSPQAILVLDPGFQAGIKCAILDSTGQVVVEKKTKSALGTVKFLGSAVCSEKGRRDLGDILRWTKSRMDNDEEEVCVVIGNGHGFREARELVTEVAAEKGISINIEMGSAKLARAFGV